MESGNAVLVKLAPSTKSVNVVSFEEAFGEHSELRGRGRARRQKRRMGRIADRGERKRARQGIRSEQQEARQTRKDVRKTRKVARKALGDEEDVVEEEENYDPETEMEASSEDETTQEEVLEGDDAGAGSEEYDFENGESFDGDADSNDFTSDAEGTPKSIHPPIASLTRKIVWNKEAMKRHGLRKNQLMARAGGLKNNRQGLAQLSAAISAITIDIQRHEARIEALENHLKNKYGDHPHVPLGYKLAAKELQKANEVVSGAQDKAMIANTIKPTVVSKGLDPNFGPNRIEVPAEPMLRTVEIQSSAEGVVGSGNTKWVLVLAGLGLAVYLAKKNKLI